MSDVFTGRPGRWVRPALLFLCLSSVFQPVAAGGGRISSHGEGVGPWVFNTEPIETVSLEFRLVEIRPAETVDLGSRTSLTGLTDGDHAEGAFWWSEDQGFAFRAGLRVREDGFEIALTLSSLDEVPFASKTVLVENYRTALVEVLEDPESRSRIALQITPKAETVPPYLPYPDELRRWEVKDAVLLRNSEEVISSGFSFTGGNGTGSPFCLRLYVRDRGMYLLSPNPFPGAGVAGGIEGRKLRFRLDGDTFELVAAEPILDGGRWLVWGRRDPDFVLTDPRFPESKFTIGVRTCNPED